MLIALLIIIGALLIALTVVLLWAHHKAFGPMPKNSSEINLALPGASKQFRDDVIARALALAEKPCEFVKTRARDGITLCARYYHNADGAPLAICFHGYHGSSIRDFAMMAPMLEECGYNILLVDERAHWRSGGRTITYGIKESRDVLSWIRYANSRFGGDTPIYLFGISLGGGTVLMAADLDLPQNVRAISADCPFNSPKEIICYVCDRYVGLPTKLMWPFVWLSALVIGHFRINSTSAVKAVAQAKLPILIIHGEADDFVPMEMSQKIRDANPAVVERHTFPDAEHGLSYMSDPARYRKIVTEFLKKHP